MRFLYVALMLRFIWKKDKWLNVVRENREKQKVRKPFGIIQCLSFAGSLRQKLYT